MNNTNPFSLNITSLKEGKYLTFSERESLQQSLTENLPPLYRTRINIILLADEGKSQKEICQQLGCTPATASRWIMLAQNGLSHKWKENSRGRPKTINQQYLQRLKELVTRSPRDFGYHFPQWTGEWLARHLAKEFDIKVSNHHINRLLKDIRPIKIQDLPLNQSPEINKYLFN